MNSENFKRYKLTRYALYWALIIIVWINIRPKKHRWSHEVAPSIADHLGLDFGWLFLAFVIMGFIAVGVHEYSRQVEPLGSLTFFRDHAIVEIDGQPAERFNYADTADLTIRRRSTWQHENRKKNYLVEFGSLLQFQLQDRSHQYEFMIKSMDHNAEFESMIRELSRRRTVFTYTTV